MATPINITDITYKSCLQKCKNTRTWHYEYFSFYSLYSIYFFSLWNNHLIIVHCFRWILNLLKSCFLTHFNYHSEYIFCNSAHRRICVVTNRKMVLIENNKSCILSPVIFFNTNICVIAALLTLIWFQKTRSIPNITYVRLYMVILMLQLGYYL